MILARAVEVDVATIPICYNTGGGNSAPSTSRRCPRYPLVRNFNACLPLRVLTAPPFGSLAELDQQRLISLASQHCTSLPGPRSPYAIDSRMPFSSGRRSRRFYKESRKSCEREKGDELWLPAGCEPEGFRIRLQAGEGTLLSGTNGLPEPSKKGARTHRRRAIAVANQRQSPRVFLARANMARCGIGRDAAGLRTPVRVRTRSRDAKLESAFLDGSGHRALAAGISKCQAFRGTPSSEVHLRKSSLHPNIISRTLSRRDPRRQGAKMSEKRAQAAIYTPAGSERGPRIGASRKRRSAPTRCSADRHMTDPRPGPLRHGASVVGASVAEERLSRSIRAVRPRQYRPATKLYPFDSDQRIVGFVAMICGASYYLNLRPFRVRVLTLSAITRFALAALVAVRALYDRTGRFAPDALLPAPDVGVWLHDASCERADQCRVFLLSRRSVGFGGGEGGASVGVHFTHVVVPRISPTCGVSADLDFVWAQSLTSPRRGRTALPSRHRHPESMANVRALSSVKRATARQLETRTAELRGRRRARTAQIHAESEPGTSGFWPREPLDATR